MTFTITFFPVFLPGESHGQRSLVGYSPQGHKQPDTTEQLTLSLHFSLDDHLLYITILRRYMGYQQMSVFLLHLPSTLIHREVHFKSSSSRRKKFVKITTVSKIFMNILKSFSEIKLSSCYNFSYILQINSE